MRRVLILGAVVATVALPATPASAYTTPGPSWPGRTIGYHETLPPSWDWSLEQAVRTWNTSGAKIRFVAVPRSRAKVLIGYGDIGSAAGLATIGHRPGAFVKMNRLMFRPLRPGVRIFAAQVLAHELGHVLGLGHVRSDNCRLMSTPLLTFCPSPPQPWLYDCAWLAKDDVRGVIRLYGGKPRRPAREYCLLEPKPGQLRDVRFQAGPRARITWTVSRQWLPRTRVVVDAYDESRCQGNTTAQPLATFDVPATRGRVRGLPAPGTYCYEVRVQNRYGLANTVQRGTVVTG